jgi:hypothetical protein
MGKNFNDQQGMAELKRRLNLAIAEQFKSLLQDKHMYQKVVIDAAKIFAEVKQDVSSAWHPEFTHAASRFSATILLTSKEGLYSQSAAGSIPDLFLIAENVKLFCAKCDRREAFEPNAHANWIGAFLEATGNFPMVRNCLSMSKLQWVARSCTRKKRELAIFPTWPFTNRTR